jgi:hypothetical protein
MMRELVVVGPQSEIEKHDFDLLHHTGTAYRPWLRQALTGIGLKV